MKKVILKNLPLILGIITIIIFIIGFLTDLNKLLVEKIYSTFGFFNEQKRKRFPNIKRYFSDNKLNFQAIGLR